VTAEDMAQPCLSMQALGILQYHATSVCWFESAKNPLNGPRATQIESDEVHDARIAEITDFGSPMAWQRDKRAE
jgi:hypothetical protein